ncbi:alpha/beta fold hydrolase [Streptomyces sp. NPDC004059]
MPAPSEDPRYRWGHGERGRLLLEPRSAWYVQGEATGLGPVTVAYERQGSGEPVVLMHGLGCHRQTWDPVIPLLTDRREIIAMDLPGFGQSPDLDPGVPRNLETAMLWLGAVFTVFLRGCPGLRAGEESDSCGAGQGWPDRRQGDPVSTPDGGDVAHDDRELSTVSRLR